MLVLQLRNAVPSTVLLALLGGGLATAPAVAYPPPGRTEQVRLLDLEGKPVAAGLVLAGNGRVGALTTNQRLVEEDTNSVADIYAVDLTTRSVELLTVAAGGGAADGGSSWPELTPDGSVVVFQSSATNLVPGDSNGAPDVFVRDRRSGTTTMASVSGAGQQGDDDSMDASISEDGRRVAFLSFADNLVPDDSNLYADIFVRDLAAGKTRRVNLLDNGAQQLTNASEPEISGDGRSVAYVTAFPVVPTDTNAPARDVYVHDLATGLNERISVGTNGEGGPAAAFYPSISDDGRHVAFSSFNPDYTGSDTNGYSESFIRDRQAGTTLRITAGDGEQGNQVVGVPVISGDGRFVTANFLATNLGFEDANDATDVYRYDRLTHEVDLVSRTAAGNAGDGISYSPTMSDDGSVIAFSSQATDLVPGGVKTPGPYLRHLGPSLGAGEVTARFLGEELQVDGWIRAGGTALVSAADPAGDAVALSQNNGGELTGATFLYRPEVGDLLVRIALAPWRHPWPPLVGTTAPKPNAMSYAVDLTVDGTPYRLTALAGPTGQAFAAYDCATTCTKIADLRGGVWTMDDGVAISVPLETLGLRPGVALADGAVRSMAGDSGPMLDSMAVPRMRVPVLSVSVAAARAGERPQDGDFSAVEPTRGMFETTLGGRRDVSELWTRTCLGAACSTSVAGIGD